MNTWFANNFVSKFYNCLLFLLSNRIRQELQSNGGDQTPLVSFVFPELVDSFKYLINLHCASFRWRLGAVLLVPHSGKPSLSPFVQSPSKSKNSHIHLFRREAKVSIHCFKADGKCFNPKGTVVPRGNKSQTTQKFLPEPNTLSFNRGKLGEMGRSLSPPHPHPTLVPPSQMKCEPGWSRTPEKLPFACQSQHLWAGQSPSCSSASQGPLAPAPRSQQASSGLWLGSWPGLLWTLLSAAQPCPPNNPVSSSAGFPGCRVSWPSLYSTLSQVYPSVLQSSLVPPAWMDVLRLPRRPGVLLPKLVLLFVYAGQW